ncbi:hypothetical protein UFOVP30_2 [uncultured Caudovirales phage]|uniref:Uncharacterized protein n=1 Tax=uncultured Caudovirales phage TaxID=2100421 RepID=A0A6J5KKR8_9CAUD|nr:hypothetical protein UFOVP30_2 [uncultured Caudovirales phage]
MTYSKSFTINTTPVLIVPALPQYQEVNLHATAGVFLGESASVSSSTGYLLDKDLNFQFRLEPNQAYYAVASVSSTLYVLATEL